MKASKGFYSRNLYIKNAIKFALPSPLVDTVFRGGFEYLKRLLFDLGLLSPVLNERIFERPFVLTNLPRKKDLKILDLGCGDSIFPLEMKAVGNEVWGADPKEYLFRNKIKFIKGDFLENEKKFPKNYFDVVTCISAIEHFGLEWALGEKIKSFDENRKDVEAIKLCCFLLKKGGSLILTAPFGKKQLFNNERVYDEKEMGLLTEGFSLVKKEVVPAQNDLIREDTNHASVFMGVFQKK